MPKQIFLDSQFFEETKEKKRGGGGLILISRVTRDTSVVLQFKFKVPTSQKMINRQKIVQKHYKLYLNLSFQFTLPFNSKLIKEFVISRSRTRKL